VKPNVILLVLDTLREDHSSGLDNLLQMGFVKYTNAISSAPWTLPSHVSMFTGLPPSLHGIHEQKGMTIEKMFGPAASQMNKLNKGILGELESIGYTTYSLSANLLPTELSGFSSEFAWYYDTFRRHLFNKEEFEYWFGSKSKPSGSALALELVKNKWFGLAKDLYFSRNRLTNKFLQNLFSKYPIEKGSKKLLKLAVSLEYRSPFFLFMNLMEAHDPYFWNETTPRAVFASVIGDDAYMAEWLKKYPVDRRYSVHSSVAVSRLVNGIMALSKYFSNSVIIVTSDHGQLIGENFRYGHGYFLNDGLLRVPLYVKYPCGVRPLLSGKGYISLCQIPSIIRYCVLGDDVRFGADTVFAESFGPQNNHKEQILTQEDAEKLDRAYSHRVKVYSHKGSMLYNVETDTIEESKGSLLKENVRDLLSVLA